MQIVPQSWINQTRKQKKTSHWKGKLFFVDGNKKKSALKAILQTQITPWAWETLKDKSSGIVHFSGTEGPIWIILAKFENQKNHDGLLGQSEYAKARDLSGSIVKELIQFSLTEIEFDYLGAKENTKAHEGALVGLEIGQYHYLEKKLPTLVCLTNHKKTSTPFIKRCAEIGKAVNTARQLINLPANELNPVSYASGLQKLFQKSKKFKVTVWDEARLKKENLNLLLAVGDSALHPPRLVKLSYRPTTPKGKPIAFVGKGITFDSGGKNIKPAQYMRLMKKDMGGSAVLVGLATWLESSSIKTPIDIYLALAENSVDQRSFRPGDIYRSRKGLTVEIHNTDAEGRLVLADAMDVATTVPSKDKPHTLIDVATLTGAGKIALGSDIASLFSTQDTLAKKLALAGHAAGDLCWRMPLFSEYKNLFSSNVADFANASDGYGGAITAALFLEPFSNGVPWAHLDIYSWANGPSGAISEKGGNGQSVQCLIRYLENLQ